jgi:hypothetical protein
MVFIGCVFVWSCVPRQLRGSAVVHGTRRLEDCLSVHCVCVCLSLLCITCKHKHRWREIFARYPLLACMCAPLQEFMDVRMDRTSMYLHTCIWACVHTWGKHCVFVCTGFKERKNLVPGSLTGRTLPMCVTILPGMIPGIFVDILFSMIWNIETWMIVVNDCFLNDYFKENTLNDSSRARTLNVLNDCFAWLFGMIVLNHFNDCFEWYFEWLLWTVLLHELFNKKGGFFVMSYLTKEAFFLWFNAGTVYVI